MKLTAPILFCFLCFGIALPVQGQNTQQNPQTNLWDEITPALGKTPIPSGTLDATALETLRDTGEILFTAPFTQHDGAGRPRATQAIIPTKTRTPARFSHQRISGPDAAACSSCHNLPFIGGAGDFVTNVFVSEGFKNHDFDTTNPEFSNERGTNHLFGAGLIELLAREMSADLTAQRAQALQTARTSQTPVRVALKTKNIRYGFITATPDGLVDLSEIDGVDTDLIIRPFSQKGVMTSLRQFTINAMNHHHGMQAEERFGERWTGEADFDEDGVKNELLAGDISALVAWQAGLPPPIIQQPDDANWRAAAARGRGYFNDLGCTSCHKMSLPLRDLGFADPGPYDAAGTLNTRDVATPAIYDLALLEWARGLPRDETGAILVPLFGDLKRHKMTDQQVNLLGNELLSQRFVGRDYFITAELWGVASTPPYGHRNDFTTLAGIIGAHGGAGRAARDAFIKAGADVQSDIIAFLKTLRIKDAP